MNYFTVYQPDEDVGSELQNVLVAISLSSNQVCPSDLCMRRLVQN